MYVDHQYIRLDTLAAENKAIIDAHKEYAATFQWGDNQMASAIYSSKTLTTCASQS